MENVDFNNLDSIKEYIFSLERVNKSKPELFDGKYGGFPLIYFSFYAVKIAGGIYNHSKPKFYYKSIKNYLEVEVILFNKSKLPDFHESVDVNKSEFFKKFEWIEYFKTSIVGGNIPINYLPIIVRDVYKIDKLLPFC